MPKYVYVGRKLPHLGKTLWEILGNLRDFGVGRLITRGSWYRYPEPSFYKIYKVQTVSPSPHEHVTRQVKTFVEKIFRGRQLPFLIEVEHTSRFADYQLIPKNEEELWYKRVAECTPHERIFDRKMPIPPLLKLILTQEKKELGEPVDEDMKMSVRMRLKPSVAARFARKNETPTHHIALKHTSSNAPYLYENIEQCRPLFVGKDPWEDYRKNYRTYWVE